MEAENDCNVRRCLDRKSSAREDGLTITTQKQRDLSSEREAVAKASHHPDKDEKRAYRSV